MHKNIFMLPMSLTGCYTEDELNFPQQSTVEARLSGPRLSGFLDYPDFFSGHNFVMNIIILVTIKIRSHILFKLQH